MTLPAIRAPVGDSVTAGMLTDSPAHDAINATAGSSASFARMLNSLTSSRPGTLFIPRIAA